MNYFIDIEFLKSIVDDDKIFKRGEDIVNKTNYIKEISCVILSNKCIFRSQVKNYSCEISCDIKSGKIIEYDCSCPFCKLKSKLCKHIVALCLEINVRVENIIPQFDTLKNDELRVDFFSSNLSKFNLYHKNKEMKKVSEVKKSQKLQNKNSQLNKREEVYSVSGITKIIKNLIEKNKRLKNIRVEGEISNLIFNKSGHIYFSIKDNYSVLNCVIFLSNVSNLHFKPSLGDKVILEGKFSLYEKRGSYQFIVSFMSKSGVGNLHEKFLKLKEKLLKEGFFDEMHKQIIPKYSQTIGIITSPSGAVIEDVINTIKRRFPKIRLILYSAIVQGENAEETIIDGIKYFNCLSKKENNKPQVIIIARGGGSLEDLFCFNSEKLAREIFKSKIPIISGVGHEVDFTICDFVADMRAPTPTAAAEIATPLLSSMYEDLSYFESKLNKSFFENIEKKRIQLNFLESDLNNNFEKLLLYKKYELQELSNKINNLNPKKILKRGFSISYDKKGKVIKNVKNVKKADEIKTLVENGEFKSVVK